MQCVWDAFENTHIQTFDGFATNFSPVSPIRTTEESRTESTSTVCIVSQILLYFVVETLRYFVVVMFQ